jgi:hypothetical protein
MVGAVSVRFAPKTSNMMAFLNDYTLLVLPERRIAL